VGYLNSVVTRVNPSFAELGSIKEIEDFEAEERETLRGRHDLMLMDECFKHKHELGSVALVKKRGEVHSACSKFYVSLKGPQSHLDGQNVVFGKVISGMRAFNLLKKVELFNQKPVKDVKISKCGAYKF